MSIVSDFEVGGGFSFSFDHPFPESNPKQSPVDINFGPSRWLSVSTDGTKLKINLGLGVGLTFVDISKNIDPPGDSCQ
ncbi:MAG: hypothetical protein KJ737_03490 [Proteobacteria bacterium]|nr:hypothetical protein [Pseudomonadota bacterium]